MRARGRDDGQAAVAAGRALPRGRGVGSAPVDACIAFARDSGYDALTLWTNNVLVEARVNYGRRGLTLKHSEPHHSFGHDLIGQYWRPGLRGKGRG